ncbi:MULTISPECIES: GumC family protein [Rhizobium]|uniref:GumC family protein n=1 Tax=Rhizobium TaxID=379 RepID=UPI001C916ADB|nr:MULTISPECIES: polysaccharide biosynthesis tyrosine autokinase [Rhizobium]MBY3037095.1 exopolysaccharide biosynthesis protein [Rhizobium laguerreae]MBY3333076.1 exopolysaccharide biosynthesis protein [Rhizobium laguerreae]MBY3516456.1 exopolysaccharide biosynthesis protein [Rhizobium laguerreae]MBY5584041.1 exopolysaccharide biosynthesis protein [Rhizobium leguminosarum]MBY5813641.1 exopolysaccharide biosynthesis protein [Rhizobium leguminosarum]
MTISTVPPDRNTSLSSMRYDPRLQVETRSDDLDLTSGLRLIRRRVVMIMAIVMLLMAVAATVISGLKPTYHAESRLIIHTPLATKLGTDESGRNDPLDATSETERLLSRSIAERVIRDLRLNEWPEFNAALQEVSPIGKIRSMLRGWIDSEKPSLPIRDSIEPIIPKYYKALRVWRDGQGDVIQIGFDASDPELAASVPNRLISIYLEERKDSLRGRVDAAEEWLLLRIDEQMGRAKAARDAADVYQKATDVASNDDDQVEQIKSIMELGERRTKIEQSRAEARATISALEAADDPSLVLQNMVIPDSIVAMQRELRAQEQDLERLLETYGNTAEAVVDARAKILKSRTDLSLATDRYLQSIHAKLAALDHEDDAIRSALAVAHEKRTRSALAQTELARLQRMADREQTALDKLEEQRRGLAAQAMLPGAELEVLSPAAVPLAPQGRGRLFYLIGALLASISIAVTAAFVVEMLDNSVRSFDQMAGMSRIVPAGFIPHLKRKDRRDPSMLFGSIQDGMFDEAIRSVMTSLKQSNGGKLPNSIVVTSAHSGEGKSLVARSLAIDLAANGIPVLLVDGDLRLGNLDSFFKSELKQGLNEFLCGQAGMRDIVHHHPSGIDFIPAGNASLHRRVRLADAADIVAMAASLGQIVIFDSAPVLASADTMHLTALAERTLVVVKWGKTSRRAVEFCLHQLKTARNAEIAVAINNVNPKQHAMYNFSDSELFVSSLRKYHEFT